MTTILEIGDEVTHPDHGEQKFIIIDFHGPVRIIKDSAHNIVRAPEDIELVRHRTRSELKVTGMNHRFSEVFSSRKPALGHRSHR